MARRGPLAPLHRRLSGTGEFWADSIIVWIAFQEVTCTHQSNKNTKDKPWMLTTRTLAEETETFEH